ncbi:MAG: TIGR04086 family membrane protein [Lachnospiraceae bacterium]|nr:TIGR04086 family membrane protein [Lachnospiraceae bacterium]
MEKSERLERGLFLLKCLTLAYILTAVLLALLALLVYRFNLSEKLVSLIIIAIYVGTTFFGGWMAGKRLQKRKFLWGLLVGSLYFLVLVVLSLIVNRSFQDVAVNFFTILALCAGGGMLGGMFS